MSERVDVVVIGAGVVGLAVARALALAGREAIVLDKNDGFGQETSARNSEVIHAGVYYRPGGWRARLCIPGKKMLYAYCAERHIAHERCEKLIVATSADEIPALYKLMETASANGLDDLKILNGGAAGLLEPALKCDAAVRSPSTGIVDSHGLMTALLGDLEEAGGALALNAPVAGGRVVDGGVELDVGGADPVSVRAKLVVNCAGLWADRVARSIDGVPADSIPKLRYGKGRYFNYSGAGPFSRLIYPIPSADSQGVHYTRDLGGQARLGPDLNYVDANDDYDIDDGARLAFAQSARRFWPDLDASKLQPGYSGIRPKTAGPGEEGDFAFSTRAEHGVDGYLGLYGIESPGLTSCLAIAETVRDMALDQAR